MFADAVELPVEQCELLGLVIAELLMNAAKHAFHGRNDGLVRVELFNRPDSWVCVGSDKAVHSVPGTVVHNTAQTQKALVAAGTGWSLVDPLSAEGFGLSWTRSGALVPSDLYPASVFARLFLEGRPDEVNFRLDR